jgi:hypothetical protein
MHVGWREWVTLPELRLRLKAKIDTGARTSALHAFALETLTRGGREWVRFKIHPIQRRTDIEVVCEAPVVDIRHVSDSSGNRELRRVIETPLEMAGLRWPIEITLTARDDMRFRMLLGRTAIRGRVLIDASRSYLTRAKQRG